MKSILTLIVASASLVAAEAVEVKQMVTVAEKNETLAGIETLTVEGKFCRVNLVKAEGAELVLNGKLEAMAENDAYEIVVEQNGSEGHVSIVVPDDPFSSFAGELSVAVPEGRTVSVVNTSGYINVDSVSTTKVSLTTVQGRVNIKNFAGEIAVDSKNGSVTAENIEGKISVSTTKGDQTFTNVKGELGFDSPDGSVTISNCSGTIGGKTVAGLQTYTDVSGTLNIKGSAGTIKLSKVEGVINIKTLSSAVNLFETKGEFHIETTKGAIIGNKGITLTTSSDFTTTEGKINLRLTNSVDDLTFSLTSESSNASLIAKGTSKKKKLNSGKGSIVITGKTKTGSQIYS